LAVVLLAANASERAPRAETEWKIADVQRGATQMADVIARRLDYETRYQMAKGVLEKNLQLGQDSDAFRLGAHLALTYWLARLPNDIGWRPKALSRHSHVTQWTVSASPLELTTVAHAVATALKLPRGEEDWLLSILKGESHAPLARPTLPASKPDPSKPDQ